MSKRMYVHHIINLILMALLMVFNFTNFGGTTALIILAVLLICNAGLLLRANKKNVKKNGVTIDDYNKK